MAISGVGPFLSMLLYGSDDGERAEYVSIGPCTLETAFNYGDPSEYIGVAKSSVTRDKDTREVYVRSEFQGLLPEEKAVEIKRTTYFTGKIYFTATLKAGIYQGDIKEATIGDYKTTYETKDGIPQGKAITVDLNTGKKVAESNILEILGEGFFKVEEKHYNKEGNICYRAILVRNFYNGLVNKVISWQGIMRENYHHYEWVTDEWPVGN